jgi:FkbM family methyltransferase
MSYVSTHSRNPHILRPAGLVDIGQLGDLYRAMLRLARTTNLPELRSIEYEESYESLFALSNVGPEVFVSLQRDRFISRSLARSGSFQFDIVERTIAQLGGPRDLLIDVGANLGTVSIPAVARGHARRALAIEADRLNYRTLMANLYLNDLQDRVVAVHAAAGATSGEMLELQTSPDNMGDHRIKTSSEPGAFGEETWPTYPVVSERIDDLVARHGLTDSLPRSLVWIDVQGWEPQVLQGATGVIAAGAAVVIEFWPYALQRNGMLESLSAFLCAQFSHLTVLNAPELPRFPATESGVAAILAHLDGGNAGRDCDLLLTRAP